MEELEKICDNACKECMKDGHKCDRENGCYWDFVRYFLKNIS